MPSPEQFGRYQKAVLWPKIAGAGDYGVPMLGPPVEVTVRWTKKRREVVNTQGDVIALDATVVVDRKIDPGSKMWLGTLDSWYGTGTAGDETEVMVVATYDETPDVRNRAVQKQVGLNRYGDKPTTT